ncbi:HNH endonuclease signature motif containing protein [Blastococcus sp. URHD0036]|uniref:HNH endonuclease signature motif containing protein n=1 Tax=Blastococcus sp. URHD0036 TaxID=1380356 RepID=UPI0012DD2345|nr:HNH endonuclease signature motif containing protein [Blastococcus sp. URHD0036]
MSRMTGTASLAEGALIDWSISKPVSLPRLPVELLDRVQTAAELQRVVSQRAMLAAYEAELVLSLADASPEHDDPPPGTRGARSSWGAETRLPGVSEFFPAELSMVLNCGRGTAAKLAVRAHTWREGLPGTFAALAAGVLDEPRAKVLAEVLEQAAPEVARRVEAQLLPQAVELSVGKLRKRAEALLAGVDPDGVDERRAETQKAADVRIYPSTRQGMAMVAVELPADEAAAVHDALTRYAGMQKSDGDVRPIGLLRTRVFADLVLRPWDVSRPPVTAQLQVMASLNSLAGTSSEAGEVSGLAITAGHLRELLRRLDALGVQPPGGGSVTLGLTDDDGVLLGTCTLDQLRQLARRGCPSHPEEDCGCAVLDRPAAVESYGPSRPQQRFVHTRDRTCRFPNCGQRVGWADADHVIPHGCGGATDCSNLCCLCRSHHRLKTFAPGWRFEMSDDGVLTVTTPSGVTRTTRPPGMRPPPEPDQPEAPPEPPGADEGAERPGPRLGTLDLIRRWRPRPPGSPSPWAQDPPPF